MSDNPLPVSCYGTLPSDGSLILIKRGETGFWRAEGYTLGTMVPTWDALADILNNRRGVSKAQRAAMEAGSCFGWDVPAADPANYGPDGGPKA
jgi:hypothetical protein